MTKRAIQLRSLAIVCASLALPIFSKADTIKRIQYPAISPDGSTIIFSWQNDLWTVDRNGGRATRLTVHAAIDSRPVWFPDGSRIAFNSTRFGSSDIFTMRPDGTELKRVTFDSSSEIPTTVSSDGRFIYGNTNLWSRGDLFRVSATGGDLQRLTSHPFEATFGASLSEDGTKVIYNRGAYRETSWQKPTMVSSALPEIWSADNTVPLTNHKRITNNEFTDQFAIPQADGSVIAVSNRGGFPNLWRLVKNEKALTNHKNGTCRYPSATSDGKYVAYEFESTLRVLDTTTGTDKEVIVTVPSDERTNPMLEVTVAGGVSQFSISPDGKRIVASARGDVFMLPEKGGTTRRLTTNAGRDYSPVWTDAKTMVYTAMEGGIRKLKSVTVDGTTKDFLSDAKLDVHAPSLSPDGKTLAFHKGDTEIWTCDPSGANPKLLIKGNFSDSIDSGSPTFTWSPDSKYVALGLIQGRKIVVTLVDVKTGKSTSVANMVHKPQKGALGVPVFLANGRGLIFTSPEFEERDLFVVDLIPADVTFSEDDLDKIDDTAKKEKPAVEVKIDEKNIDQRLRRLTRKGCGAYTTGPDGRSIYATTESGLVSINPTTGTETPLLPSTGLAIQGLDYVNGKLYVLNNGQMTTFTPGGTALSPISMNAQFMIDAKAEELALFEEISWALDRQYYDPGMNKKDWNGLKSKYKSLVPYAYDRTDFYRMMGEMMEELDSSHLGSTAPPTDYPGTGTESTGFLGIDLDPVAINNSKEAIVARVVPNSPADHPASQLMVGDKILSVNGEKVGTTPLAALLNKTVLKKVTLVVQRGKEQVTVAIKPSANAVRTALEYTDYVKTTRERVEKLSEGKLGYVHIAAMDQASLDLFLREIRTQGEGKQGLVIDCRFNGGGSTAVDVLGVLVRTPWLMRTTRGEFGVKLSENIYRSDALELPTALMVNTFSFSNAEVIAEGFRKLKLGPIVGERTPGYVIGTGAFSLWDGGTIRMPSIGAYAINGENLENNGRRPDHLVWFDPNAWFNNRDLQIERAVTELLKTIK
jgi:tricorn protease